MPTEVQDGPFELGDRGGFGTFFLNAPTSNGVSCDGPTARPIASLQTAGLTILANVLGHTRHREQMLKSVGRIESFFSLGRTHPS